MLKYSGPSRLTWTTLRDALRRAPWIRVDERRGGDEGESHSVWPTDGVQVNFFFAWGAPIEFDFDLREMIDDEAVTSLFACFGW